MVEANPHKNLPVMLANLSISWGELTFMEGDDQCFTAITKSLLIDTDSLCYKSMLAL